MTERENEVSIAELKAKQEAMKEALDETRAELKAARGFVWKTLAAVIGMLAAQWAKIMGLWS